MSLVITGHPISVVALFVIFFALIAVAFSRPIIAGGLWMLGVYLILK